MAIPLVYKSCLYETSLDQAIFDYADFFEKNKEQEKKRAEFQEEEDQKKEDALKSGEEYVAAEFRFPEIETPPFLNKEEKLVVCLDTLGQDRQLTDDQKRFALETVAKFKTAWENFDEQKLRIDRDARIRSNEEDKAWLEENLERLLVQETKFVEE